MKSGLITTRLIKLFLVLGCLPGSLAGGLYVFGQSSGGKSKARQSFLDFSESMGEEPQQWDEASRGSLTGSTGSTGGQAGAGLRASNLPSWTNFPEMKNDATIHDIFFLNVHRGFAVGDRGTIWATSDGGQSWKLIESSVDATLHSVHFVSDGVGIIVGGKILTGSPAGRGVILRTTDGGQSWQEAEHPSYPILRKVRFINPDSLWMVGDSSELYPGGVFESHDGGNSWESLRGNRHPGWVNVLFDPVTQTAIGIGQEGGLQRLSATLVQQQELPIGHRRLESMTQVLPGDPIRIAGEGGLIMQRCQTGEPWTMISAGLPIDVSNYFDFCAIWGTGEKIVVAGSPGTVIFSTENGGESWHIAQTGYHGTIKTIVFADPLNGWAAGELGTILVTRDGGQSWSVQRAGGARFSILNLVGFAEEIPPETLLQYSAQWGYLTKVYLLAREENREKTNDELAWLQKVKEAVVNSGASAVGQSSSFLLDPKELNDSIDEMLVRFDRENDSKGLERFRENLVRQIRIARPEVILIPAATSSGFAAFLDRELPRAIQNATDPLIYPEHFTLCRLAPWKVKKVFAASFSDQALGNTGGGSITQSLQGVNESQVDSLSFAPPLGRTIGEMSRQTRIFLDPTLKLLPRFNHLQILYDGATGSASEEGVIRQTAFTPSMPGQPIAGESAPEVAQGIMSRLGIPYGTESRRQQSFGLLERREELSNRTAKRREIIAIANSFGANTKSYSSEIILTQIDQMIRGTDPQLAVEYLVTLGKRLAGEGRWSAAEEVMAKAVLEFPEEEGVREALKWLVQFYSSRELHWRTQDKNRYRESQQELDSNASLQNVSRLAIDSSAVGNRLRNVNDLGKTIRELYPDLYMTPEIRFPLASAMRQSGNGRQTMQFYFQRSLNSRDDLWGVRARAEHWLMTPNKETLPPAEQFPPLAMTSCRATSLKPYLDGIPEEDVWGGAAQIVFTPEDQDSEKKRYHVPAIPLASWQKENRKKSVEFGTCLSFLYDHDFLYLAIHCRKVSEIDYSREEAPRQRKADLLPHDRVEIELDLDRDYTTAYRFVFDSRGWVNESIGDDRNWSPAIFVAQNETQDTWSLEVAIPLEQIVEKPPTRADVWSLSARRIVPGIGVESWNAENSENCSKGFGFLTFGY